MKYLDNNGLTTYNSLIKNYINNYAPASVKNAYNSNQIIKFALCTQAEYDAISSPDSNTLYIIKDFMSSGYYHHFVKILGKSTASSSWRKVRVGLHIWLPTKTIYSSMGSFIQYVANLCSTAAPDGGTSTNSFHNEIITKSILNGVGADGRPVLFLEGIYNWSEEEDDDVYVTFARIRMTQFNANNLPTQSLTLDYGQYVDDTDSFDFSDELIYD